MRNNQTNLKERLSRYLTWGRTVVPRVPGVFAARSGGGEQRCAGTEVELAPGERPNAKLEARALVEF